MTCDVTQNVIFGIIGLGSNVFGSIRMLGNVTQTKLGLIAEYPTILLVFIIILAVDIDCDFIICDNGDTGIEDCIMQVFEFIWWMKS